MNRGLALVLFVSLAPTAAFADGPRHTLELSTSGGAIDHATPWDTARYTVAGGSLRYGARRRRLALLAGMHFAGGRLVSIHPSYEQYGFTHPSHAGFAVQAGAGYVVRTFAVTVEVGALRVWVEDPPPDVARGMPIGVLRIRVGSPEMLALEAMLGTGTDGLLTDGRLLAVGFWVARSRYAVRLGVGFGGRIAPDATSRAWDDDGWVISESRNTGSLLAWPEVVAYAELQVAVAPRARLLFALLGGMQLPTGRFGLQVDVGRAGGDEPLASCPAVRSGCDRSRRALD